MKDSKKWKGIVVEILRILISVLSGGAGAAALGIM